MRSAHISDHGLLDYLLDLWDHIFTPFQHRLSFLTSLTLKEYPRQIYAALDLETQAISAFKSEAFDIYALIRRKEDLVGNVLGDRYHQVEHRSELFGLRAEIIKKIEDYTKAKIKGKRLPILWHGIPYLDICKLERMDADQRLKEEIREEIEHKRMKRGTTFTTYNKLMI